MPPSSAASPPGSPARGGRGVRERRGARLPRPAGSGAAGHRASGGGEAAGAGRQSPGRGTGAPRPGDATVHQAQARLALLPSALTALWYRLPRPRLTGLGSGLLAALLMVAVGGLDALVLEGSPAVYGVFFVLVSTVTAAWVRPAELFAAPVSVPLAFVAGIFFISDGTPGLAGQLMGIFSTLALQAGWLYAGTLAAALIALGRKLTLIGQRARATRARRARRKGR